MDSSSDELDPGVTEDAQLKEALRLSMLEAGHGPLADASGSSADVDVQIITPSEASAASAAVAGFGASAATALARHSARWSFAWTHHQRLR